MSYYGIPETIGNIDELIIHRKMDTGLAEMFKQVYKGDSSADWVSQPEDILDIIEHQRMSFSEGNIFKAIYRLGKKNHEDYDLNKIMFFSERLMEKAKHGTTEKLRYDKLYLLTSIYIAGTKRLVAY